MAFSVLVALSLMLDRTPVSLREATPVALVAPPAGFAGTEDAERSIDFMRRLAAENDGDVRVLR